MWLTAVCSDDQSAWPVLPRTVRCLHNRQMCCLVPAEMAKILESHKIQKKKSPQINVNGIQHLIPPYWKYQGMKYSFDWQLTVRAWMYLASITMLVGWLDSYIPPAGPFAAFMSYSNVSLSRLRSKKKKKKKGWTAQRNISVIWFFFFPPPSIVRTNGTANAAMLWVWLPELWAHWQIRLSETIQGWNISQASAGLWQTLIKLISRIKFKVSKYHLCIDYFRWVSLNIPRWKKTRPRGRGISGIKKKKKQTANDADKHGVCSAIMRASANPARSRTMLVKSNTQLSRLAG